jgi:hypothetical protein
LNSALFWLAAPAAHARLRFGQFGRQPMRSAYKIEQSVRPRVFVFQELGYFFHTSAESGGQGFGIAFRRSLLAGNNGQENGIGIVDVKSSGSGIPQDRVLVEEYFRILLQDTGMLHFEISSDAVQDIHRETLRPPMLEQAQPGVECESFVL